ncbi:MAG: adenylate kinase [Pyrinomonadaceae bacterium]|nr:adenylate kinase [Pyrinomonadaceae bacterium]
MTENPVNIDTLKRIVVIGSSCAGKTTFARKLSRVLNAKNIEMDWLNWLPNWEERPTEELREMVDQETSAEKWVLDGNYSRTRDIAWNRATHAIWLNVSFPLAMVRAIKRTTKRAVTGEEICGGNRETFRHSFLSTDSMIIWSLRTYHSRRRRYRKQVEENQYKNLSFIVFENSRDPEEFLKTLESNSPAR